MDKFTRYQKQVLVACFTVYFCAYIGRLNMSAALGAISSDLQVKDVTAGMLQTLFAAAYATGQLVFGALSDRYQPRRLLLTGLIGSTVMNALFSVSGSFALIAVIWTLNGVFQSMLWTPIVRLLAQNFDGKQRSTASLVMSFTLAAGHFFAWLLAGGMVKAFSWRMSFAAPSVVLASAAAFAYFALPKGERTERASSGVSSKVSISVLLKSGLAFMLFGCVMNGFVRDSVITWSPTILGSSSDSLLFTLIIPVINLFGIILGAYLVRHIRGSVRQLIASMMGAVAVFALLVFLLGGTGIAVLALLLGLISAMLYGSNPLITAMTPMEYDWAGRVGLVAGLIDCSIYVGSALSGSLVGYIHDVSGSWSSIYLVWIAAALLGTIAVFASCRGRRA